MKKVLVYLLVFFIVVNHSAAYCQDVLPDFGKIDAADLQLQNCSFDEAANAMNLIKTEVVSFTADQFTGTVKTTTEYRVRIKIFNENGFKHANIVIPYSTKSHSVKINDVEGFIYNLDNAGNIVAQKLDKSQVYREKSKSANSLNSIRFTFTGLQKGSVIEYRYTRVDRNAIYLPPWLFQDQLPCRITKCAIKVPAFIHAEFHFVAHQYIDKDETKTSNLNDINNITTHTFTMYQLPAFKPEPLMTSLKDNLQRVDFATLPGGRVYLNNANIRWRQYNNMLLNDPLFGRQFDTIVENTASFFDTVLALKQKDDIIKTVYGFVRRNVTWNGEHNFYPADIAECWNDKTGSSAEMNILLLNLLRKAGIECYPILISTRDNGMVDRTFANLGQFNGVDVVVVDSGKLLYVLDCTQKNPSFKVTPRDILYRQALLVDRASVKWLAIANDWTVMRTKVNATAVMDSTGVINGSAEIFYTGMAKDEAISDAQKSDKEKEHENAFNIASNDGGDLKIDSAKLLHEHDDNDTLLRNITFHYTPSNTGDIYFVNPFMFSTFKKNPFIDTERLSEIDFGCPQLYRTSILISIPQNFSIDDIPKTASILIADSSIEFKREIFVSPNNQLLIRNYFSINRPLYSTDEYTGLKTFFDKVYALINEQILLKKKR